MMAERLRVSYSVVARVLFWFRSKHRALRALFITFCVVLGIGVLSGTVLCIRLAYKPLSVNFLKKRFLREVRKHYPGFDCRSIYLYWPRFSPNVHLYVRGAHVPHVFSLERLDLTLPFSRLWKGRFVPYGTKITCIQVRLSVPSSKPNSPTTLSSIKKDLARLIPFFFKFKDVDIHGATFYVTDDVSNVIFPNLRCFLTHRGKRGLLRLITEKRPSHFNAILPEEKEKCLQKDEIPFLDATLAYQIERPSKTECKRLWFTFNVRKLFFPKAFVPYTTSQVHLVGLVKGDLPLSGEGTWKGAMILKQPPGTVLEISGVENKPIPVVNASIKAKLSEEALLRGVLDGKVMGTSLLLHTSTLGRTSTHGWKLLISARVLGKGIPIHALGNVWLNDLAVGARNWILEHFSGGRVSYASCNVGMECFLRGLQRPRFVPGKVLGSIHIDHVNIPFLEGLPPVENVCARSVFDDQKFDITVDSGRFSQHTVGPLGRVLITGLDKPLQKIDIQVPLKGALKPLLETLDLPRLHLIHEVPLVMDQVKGQDVTRLRIGFPLLADLQMKDVCIDTSSTLSRVAFPVTLGKHKVQLSEGDVAIAFSKNKLAIEGKSTLNTIKSQWCWHQNLADRKSGSFRLSFSPTLQQLSCFLPFPLTPYVDDRTPMPATVFYRANQSPCACITLDLSPVTLDIPWVRWKKGRGEPLELRSELTLSSDKEPCMLHVHSKGVCCGNYAAGFTCSGDICSLKGKWSFPHHGPSKGAPYKIAYNDSALQSLALSLPFADLSSWLSHRREEQKKAKAKEKEKDKNRERAKSKAGQKPQCPKRAIEASPSRAFHVDVKADRILLEPYVSCSVSAVLKGKRLFGALPFSDFSNIIWHEGKAHVNCFLDHLLPPTRDAYPYDDKDVLPSIRLSIQPLACHHNGQTHASRLSLAVINSGDLLRLAGISERFFGGDLTLMATQNYRGHYVGRVQAQKLEVETPFVVRLLSFVSLSGVADLISGTQLFETLSLDFSYRDPLFTIEKLCGKGFSLGFFLNGSANMDTTALNFKGSILPMYFLNMLLSYVPFLNHIPLIGHIFGEERGIFSTDFTISGFFDDISVRPSAISTLSPALLNQLFESLRDTE